MNAARDSHRTTLLGVRRLGSNHKLICLVRIGTRNQSQMLADDPERASRGGWCFDATAPDPLIGAPDLKVGSGVVDIYMYTDDPVP